MIHFNPSGKNFAFNMNCYNCFEIATGKCLLEASEDFKEDKRNKIDEGKDIFNRCRIISTLLIQQRLRPVSIEQFKCGHYEVSDGQHRVCIASKMKIEVTSYLTQYNHEVCSWCKNPKKKENVYYIKKL